MHWGARTRLKNTQYQVNTGHCLGLPSDLNAGSIRGPLPPVLPRAMLLLYQALTSIRSPHGTIPPPFTPTTRALPLPLLLSPLRASRRL